MEIVCNLNVDNLLLYIPAQNCYNLILSFKNYQRKTFFKELIKIQIMG